MHVGGDDGVGAEVGAQYYAAGRLDEVGELLNGARSHPPHGSEMLGGGLGRQERRVGVGKPGDGVGGDLYVLEQTLRD